MFLCPRREADVSNEIAEKGAKEVEVVYEESGGIQPDWDFPNLCSPMSDELGSPDVWLSDVDSEAPTQRDLQIDCPRGCGQAFTYTDLKLNQPCVCGSNM